MPINKETIISVFDDKLTLMQWLKTINKALEDAVLTGVEITKKGNATLSFKFTFEDGTFLETNDIVLQQGESVNGAYIQNGHLYLTLTNGTNLDAGNVKPVSSFAINASGHLIVNYGDGTSQDLGSLGDFSNVDFVAKTLKQTQPNYEASYTGTSSTIGPLTPIYNRVQFINNVLYFILNIKATATAGTSYAGWEACSPSLTLSDAIAEKVIDLSGHNVKEADQTSLITAVPCTITKGYGRNAPRYKATLMLHNSTWQGGMNAIVLLDENIEKEEGADYYITARIALTIF